MKTGRSTAKNEVSKASVAKGLLGVVGIGLVSGIALVGATDKVMSKLFPETKKEAAETIDEETSSEE